MKVYEFVTEYTVDNKVERQRQYVLADSFHEAIKALEIELIDERHEVIALAYVCNIVQDLRGRK